MSTEDAQKLHARADYFRAISLDGNDVHLKVALLQLAEDFDLEAANLPEHRIAVGRAAETMSALRCFPCYEKTCPPNCAST
jgi:hypothetical protein